MSARHALCRAKSRDNNKEYAELTSNFLDLPQVSYLKEWNQMDLFIWQLQVCGKFLPIILIQLPDPTGIMEQYTFLLEQEEIANEE